MADAAMSGLLSPAPQTAATAATTVLGIPELFAEILANMDMQTLLLAQRVSRTWHTAIVESPELQRKLFLEPIVAEKPEDITDPSIRVVNPLLNDKFPTFFPAHDLHSQDSTHYHLRRMYYHKSPFWFMDGHKGTDEEREVFLRRDASWRRMLVQQPACPKLGFIEHHGAAEQTYRKAVVDCRRQQGLRMGQLYDLVYQFAGTSKHQNLHHGFAVYRRVPKLDPPLHAYSYRCGGEEVALSTFKPEVGFVLLRNAHGSDYFSVNGITRTSQLLPDYRPVEWKPCSLKVEVSNEQDWFG